MSTEDVETVTVSMDDSAFREAMAGAQREIRRLDGLRQRFLEQVHADAVAAYRSWGLSPPPMSRIDVTERVLSSYSYGADTASFDSRSEHCWRCDARGAETDVGLCTSCHDDLRTP
jgi:hypothetical protein